MDSSGFRFGDLISIIFLVIILGPILARFLKPKANILVFSVNGVISHNQQFDKLLTWLNRIIAEKIEPRALVMRVNSPGGTVGASQELYSCLNKIREKGIKVVAVMEDVAASGGLYACMAADAVVAQPGTLTGSIGVIMSNYDISSALDRLNIKSNTIKSGKYKDSFSSTRPMTEEDRALLQNVIDDTHGQFCQAVSAGRGVPIEFIESFADGRIMTGRQAFKLGLVDKIGGLRDGVDVAIKLAEINEDLARLENLIIRETFFERFSGGGALFQKIFGVSLPDKNLSGIPLWLMPTALN